MTLWILDTDQLTLFLHGNPSICQCVASTSLAEIAVTIVTGEEVLAGRYAELRRARRDEHLVRAYSSLQETIELFKCISILPLDLHAASRFHNLRKIHRRHGTNDLRIAAIAMEHLGVVVTKNRADFAVVEGLTTEDWS